MARSAARVRRIGLGIGSLLALVALLGLGPGALTSRAAGAATVDLDQWASTDHVWQNGNLNGNNSRYPEGGVVPFRIALEGLSVGIHEIRINYDFTAGGHKAYDFLATWNATNASGAICSPSGGAISSMCPALPGPSTMAFPTDVFSTDGLTVAGAQAYSGMARRLTMWGGAILAISSPSHSGSTAGNSSADVVVRFRANGSAVLLAWGGHLAQSSFWDAVAGGSADGARMVSGAPWHMRTLGLDGAGSKNQDRSIQPSAIVGELPPGGGELPPGDGGGGGGGGGGGSPTLPPVIPSLGPLDPSVTPPPTSTRIVGGGSPGDPFSWIALAAGAALYGLAGLASWSARRRQ